VLANACVSGDTVVTQSYSLATIANALPLTGGTVTGSTTFTGQVSAGQLSINSVSASGYTGFKNRIINGGMTIDQRNSGASVTVNSTTGYILDRWSTSITQNGKLTAQQSPIFLAPLAGFKNYLSFTSTSAYTVLTGDTFSVFQSIEGQNIADLGWGTVNAQTVTLSFWVRSSLTGTFGGALQNSGGIRSYPFSYTINSANTWEFETITIVGDTAGTWLTTNGVGITVFLGLGAGTLYSGTAGAWVTGNIQTATGSTSVVGTSGATWFVTGVQLERGSNATSFEFRDYGRELMMCQRYCLVDTYTVSGGNNRRFVSGYMYSTTQFEGVYTFPVEMRTAPTLSTTALNTFTAGVGGTTPTSISAYMPNTRSSLIYTANPAYGAAGYGTSLCSVTTNGVVTTITWTSEL
jgi:hypothetical protein